MTRREEEIKTARDMLKGWIKAEQAVMTGQEYRMGTKTLRRADLDMIGKRIQYWTDEVKRAEGVTHIKIRQAIPRDV